jgi:hypothetical protein
MLDFQLTLSIIGKNVHELNKIGQFLINNNFIAYILIYLSTFIVYLIIKLYGDYKFIKEITSIIIGVSMIATINNVIIMSLK